MPGFARRLQTTTKHSVVIPSSNKMLIGGRTKTSSNESNMQLRTDFSAMSATIGPLKMTRAFESTLPSAWDSVSAPGVTEFVSYKNNGGTTYFTSYLNSCPAGTKIIYYHEPEGPTDWTDGPTFVSAYIAQYDLAKSIRPELEFGMVAGGYQYRTNGRGKDGSYLPPANKVDFYGIDTYRDGTDTGFNAVLPLAQIGEFQTWYNLVKDRGKSLYVTEYGRGIVGMNEIASTPTDRVNAINADATYLESLGFKGWLYWYCNYGPDGRSWQFVDQGSINAWSAVAAANN